MASTRRFPVGTEMETPLSSLSFFGGVFVLPRLEKKNTVFPALWHTFQRAELHTSDTHAHAVVTVFPDILMLTYVSFFLVLRPDETYIPARSVSCLQMGSPLPSPASFTTYICMLYRFAAKHSTLLLRDHFFVGQTESQQ